MFKLQVVFRALQSLEKTRKNSKLNFAMRCAGTQQTFEFFCFVLVFFLFFLV